MLDDNHSRRRVNKPAPLSKDRGLGQNDSESQKLTDVAAILDEIEGLVAQTEPTDPDQIEPTTSQTAQSVSSDPTPVPQVDPSTTEADFDINELEAELENAIASELGEEIHNQTTEEVIETTSSNTNEVAETLQPPIEQEDQTTEVEAVDPTDLGEVKMLSTTPTPTGFTRMMITIASPLENLAPRDRLIVNIAVLSLVLWVPLIWFLTIQHNSDTAKVATQLQQQAAAATPIE